MIPAASHLATCNKAKAEKGVQLVEQWILARLRNQQFFGLDTLNEHIGYLLEELGRQALSKAGWQPSILV